MLFVDCGRGRRTLVGGFRSGDQLCRYTVVPARSSASAAAPVLCSHGATAGFSHIFVRRTLVGGFGVSIGDPSNDGPTITSDMFVMRSGPRRTLGRRFYVRVLVGAEWLATREVRSPVGHRYTI